MPLRGCGVWVPLLLSPLLCTQLALTAVFMSMLVLQIEPLLSDTALAVVSPQADNSAAE